MEQNWHFMACYLTNYMVVKKVVKILLNGFIVYERKDFFLWCGGILFLLSEAHIKNSNPPEPLRCDLPNEEKSTSHTGDFLKWNLIWNI